MREMVWRNYEKIQFKCGLVDLRRIESAEYYTGASECPNRAHGYELFKTLEKYTYREFKNFRVFLDKIVKDSCPYEGSPRLSYEGISKVLLAINLDRDIGQFYLDGLKQIPRECYLKSGEKDPIRENPDWLVDIKITQYTEKRLWDMRKPEEEKELDDVIKRLISFYDSNSV